jgi:hypothetical protein
MRLLDDIYRFTGMAILGVILYLPDRLVMLKSIQHDGCTKVVADYDDGSKAFESHDVCEFREISIPGVLLNSFQHP